MKEMQQRFGSVDIRQTKNGICEKCGQSAYVVILRKNGKNHYYCKTHSRQSWINEAEK